MQLSRDRALPSFPSDAFFTSPLHHFPFQILSPPIFSLYSLFDSLYPPAEKVSAEVNKVVLCLGLQKTSPHHYPSNYFPSHPFHISFIQISLVPYLYLHFRLQKSSAEREEESEKEEERRSNSLKVVIIV